MNIADYLDEVVDHEASLAGDDENLLTEDLWHEDPVAIVTDVPIECANTTELVVAPFLSVLSQLCPIPGVEHC